MLNEMFESFDILNSKLHNPILELSVKQNRVKFCLEDYSLITRHDFDIIDSFAPITSISEIISTNDVIELKINNLSEEFWENLSAPKEKEKDTSSALYYICSVIYDLRDVLCTCPALEFCISKDYIKIYLDVPNVTVNNLLEVQDLFASEGILEVNKKRPYLLFIRDW